MLTAVALGLRQGVADAPADEAVVVDARDAPPAPDAPLDLHFDPRSPDDTWAVVHPWLLGREPV